MRRGLWGAGGWTRRDSGVGALAILFVVAGLGCTADTILPPAMRPSSVFIESVERLDTPVVGHSTAFLPAKWIETNQPPATRLADFALTAATNQPARLMLRLAASEAADAPINLVRVDPPAQDSDAGVRRLIAANESTCAVSGCFWLPPDSPSSRSLSHRVRVLVPDALLSDLPWLELFVSETAGGTPLAADRIQLTQSFFYLAALGDSIVWGNGLRDRQKFRNIVADTIEHETGRKVVPQVLAVSGAEIVGEQPFTICDVGCSGEAPTGVTPILVQAERVQQPELMDLILLDGCANDVGLAAILSPLTDPVELADATRGFCGEQMVNLLRKVRSAAPQAPIVVSGYYPFVSSNSLEGGAEELGVIQGVARDDLNGVDDPLSALVVNSTVFDAESRAALEQAVATVNAEGGSTDMVAFADPGFSEQNAVFASQSWVWNLKQNADLADSLGLDLRLFPEDPLLDFRVERCTQTGVVPDLVSCIYASLAHPNPTGAQAYADAITDRLRDLGVLPVMQPNQPAHR